MGVVEDIREVADHIRKSGDIDLWRKIINTEEKVVELTRQLRAAESRAEELEDALKFKKKLNFKAPFYYADGDVIPFCPKCWEADKKAIHMLHIFTNEESTRHDCAECGKMILVDRGGRSRFDSGAGGQGFDRF